MNKIDAKIEIIEAEINMMKGAGVGGGVGEIGKGGTHLIFGGLDQGATYTQAEDWVRKQLVSARLAVPVDCYLKGEKKYEGFIFARFANPQAADDVVTAFRRNQVMWNGRNVWCNADQPCHVRMPCSFLLKLKKLLVSWKFSKQSVRVDEETNTMKVIGKEVLKVKVEKGAMKLDWLDSQWQEWQELHSAPEFIQILTQCNEALNKAAQWNSKGVGKGEGTQ